MRSSDSGSRRDVRTVRDIDNGNGDKEEDKEPEAFAARVPGRESVRVPGSGVRFRA